MGSNKWAFALGVYVGFACFPIVLGIAAGNGVMAGSGAVALIPVAVGVAAVATPERLTDRLFRWATWHQRCRWLPRWMR
ncbi:hypothetical protein M0638_19685 [Roseomonas sp. NAR14]|uniref:Uncharacterized protein n=1 Tax=Roseomonas acroporae TaxID=2937791 RepID=A0A9X1YI47_9PROT|nr:hypothetical protein [Roseomonas acroporae]MCK8786601.1 hypothetical protein [Roseomonas acroporae]